LRWTELMLSVKLLPQVASLRRSRKIIRTRKVNGWRSHSTHNLAVWGFSKGGNLDSHNNFLSYSQFFRNIWVHDSLFWESRLARFHRVKSLISPDITFYHQYTSVNSEANSLMRRIFTEFEAGTADRRMLHFWGREFRHGPYDLVVRTGWSLQNCMAGFQKACSGGHGCDVFLFEHSRGNAYK
jgi:hypothetical protein